MPPTVDTKRPNFQGTAPAPATMLSQDLATILVPLILAGTRAIVLALLVLVRTQVIGLELPPLAQTQATLPTCLSIKRTQRWPYLDCVQWTRQRYGIVPSASSVIRATSSVH